MSRKRMISSWCEIYERKMSDERKNIESDDTSRLLVILCGAAIEHT